MSIHKSKGLEFPVVFLCGTGKEFNMMDLKENLLLHQDMGFGPKYMNFERKIEYPTLAKEALKMKSKNENLSEEMRLLYVALTRSKEKVIITGTSKEVRGKSSGNILISELKGAKCYLDWLKIIVSANEENISNVLDVHYHNKNDILLGDENIVGADSISARLRRRADMESAPTRTIANTVRTTQRKHKWA